MARIPFALLMTLLPAGPALAGVDPIPAAPPIAGPVWSVVVPAVLFLLALVATILLYRYFARR